MFENSKELRNRIHELSLQGHDKSSIVDVIFDEVTSFHDWEVIARAAFPEYVYDVIRKVAPAEEVVASVPRLGRVPKVIVGLDGKERPAGRASRAIDNGSLDSRFLIRLSVENGTKLLSQFTAEDCRWHSALLSTQASDLQIKAGRWDKAAHVLLQRGPGRVLGDLTNEELDSLELV